MSYLYDVINKTPDIMPIKYRLVLRKDMTKGAAAGSKLYYAVNKSTGTCDFEELCDQIADRSTASRGGCVGHDLLELGEAGDAL